jgi:hypothetical protein
MNRFLATILVATLSFAANAVADPGDGFGSLFFEGDVYRTFGVPAAVPMGGRDDIYPIIGGVEGQLAVSSVAPGHPGYHGGLWAVWPTMWNAGVEPYLLTSVEDVMDAYMAGDVSIVRMPDADFRCPVLPGRPNR